MDNNEQRYSGFNELFESLMFQLGTHANRRIVELLEKDGMILTQRTLQRYRTGERVPDLITAKQLLKTLNCKISDKELIRLLKKEKKDISKSVQIMRATGYDEHPEERGVKVFNVKVDTSQLDINASEDISVSDILISRISELYGGAGSLELYVRKLIENDINGLIENEENENDK